ncbi:hypothetical protein BKA82DRAFT_4097378 [Pisolithus tinctorius]|nr:hypothetical protein BKA82DRAFT_4097378 [Pisolithus tinctorius]
MKHNRWSRLRTFQERPVVTFAPTYKYDQRSDAFSTSEKRCMLVRSYLYNCCEESIGCHA